MNIEHEGIYMLICIQSMKGDVRRWLKQLLINSIDSREALEDTVMRKWGEKRSCLYYLIECAT